MRPIYRSAARWGALLVSAAVLTGCAGIKTIEPKAEQLQAIRSIAVATTPEPVPLEVRNLKHPGFAFGAIGGAIVAADWNDKQARLAQAMQPLAPAPATQFGQQVVEHLKRLGYEVRPAAGPWQPQAQDKPGFDPVAAGSGADALLVLAPRIAGFVAAPGHDYLPTLHADVRLYGRAGGTPLLQATYATGWAPEQQQLKATATRGREFGNFETLMSDPAATAESLQRAASLLAERVAQDLQR
ncbi:MULTISPECIES: hypothetical protein [unclassified Roseateles]|uniref:hypothetical protein n=1 Tax=unclassified Roseateles TaxID=2626991 RepID=UPI0006F4ED92|nr:MULTISPECIES: hypothetical protein [unclassified Roseateles]KQW51474.1 hypothetical protein ASC81_02200 [Pelomonas sp. Root405]KRA77707.1 hypothetical protein ASD88_02200 [Pelomonas sp. Root662]